MANKVLICLGMHRSGTSLIASWLNRCGLNMGDKMFGADEFNKNGYFEDVDFLHLHEEIFQFNNITPGGLIPPVNIRLNTYYQRKLEYLIALKNSLHVQWGWKDPRTCLFIDFYRQLIPQAKYLIIYRDYPYVVDSLIRRRLKDVNDWYGALSYSGKIRNYKLYRSKQRAIMPFINIYLDAWNMYNRKLLDLAASVNRADYFLADYSDIKKDASRLFDQLTAWGFSLQFVPFDEVFDPALMTETLPELPFDPVLAEEAVTIKNRLQACKASKIP